jgi:hypothetical protein
MVVHPAAVSLQYIFALPLASVTVKAADHVELSLENSMLSAAPRAEDIVTEAFDAALLP